MTQSLAHPKTRSPRAACIAVVALFAMLASVGPRPARADSASTTATLLGAAAAAAATVISNNVRHKQAQANTPVGRTQDGGTILGNGRVVYPNGDVLYTGNGGQRCTYDGYGVPCTNQPAVYYPRGYAGERHDRGHHYGWYKHHGHGHDNDDYDDDRGPRGPHGIPGPHGPHDGDHGDHGDHD